MGRCRPTFWNPNQLISIEVISHRKLKQPLYHNTMSTNISDRSSPNIATDTYQRNKVLDVYKSDIFELVEQITDEKEKSDLMYVQQYKEEVGNVLLQALNEYIDQFIVDVNKHLKEHHRIAINNIISDNQHFLDDRYLG